jgi:hypothetical protein
MANSTETTAAADLKVQLEAIAGHTIDANPEQLTKQLIKWLFPVSAYAFTSSTDADAAGHVISKNLIIFRPPVCATYRLLDVDGYSNTLASGTQVFSINDFICPDDRTFFYDEPVNVVVTPRSMSPFFLTMTYSLVYTPPSPYANNVQITVFAWDANGSPAPDVEFHWRCRVPTYVVIE